MSPKTIRLITRFHKILGVVIGIQLFFWTLSGLYFTIFDIDTIHGDHLRRPIVHGTLEPDEVSVSVQDAMAASGIWGFDAKLQMFMGKPVWLVTNSHDKRLVDANTGEKLSPLTEEVANDVFKAGAPGLASLKGQLFLLEDNAPREYGGPLPAWVYQTDQSGERVYLDAMTGEIRAVRTTEWRLFDILWRFHIMDVTGEDSFSTWWLKVAAFIGFAMVVSGLIILVQRLTRRKLLT